MLVVVNRTAMAMSNSVFPRTSDSKERVLSGRQSPAFWFLINAPQSRCLITGCHSGAIAQSVILRVDRRSLEFDEREVALPDGLLSLSLGAR
jgi:hypothetical protein